MTEICLGVMAVILLIIVISLFRINNSLQAASEKSEVKELLQQETRNLKSDISSFSKTMAENNLQAVNALGGNLQNSLSSQLEQFRNVTGDSIRQMENRIRSLEKVSNDRLAVLNEQLNSSLAVIREENSKQLAEIRGTVDEKLQDVLEKRISESFRTVSERLEAVYRGLGEMKNLASDVGSLKKVLAGVKTRGMLGEVQLGAILEEIMSPGQYEKNVRTVKGSSAMVEFAIKLPGSGEETVWLPIDSKFPGDTYSALQDAKENGDRAAIESAYKELESVIKKEARDIKEKYISPPGTTNFGIMFLPFEGLYLEVIERGLVEKLQHDYQVNVAGPSTMAAYLNSLQLGFRTLAIQKRSNEVWEVLAAVKAEFEKFEEALAGMQKHLNATSKDLDNLIGTRTRGMKKKLDSIELLDGHDPEK